MTPEALEDRRKQLESGIAMLRAKIADTEQALQTLRTNLSGTMGALQECQYWINQAHHEDAAETGQ